MRRVLETVLLRVDEDAMAKGTVFWQGIGDAVEVDAFTSAGVNPPQVAIATLVFSG